MAGDLHLEKLSKTISYSRMEWVSMHHQHFRWVSSYLTHGNGQAIRGVSGMRLVACLMVTSKIVLKFRLVRRPEIEANNQDDIYI